MTHRDFAYWLKGWVELNGENAWPNYDQWQEIKKHLNICFNCEATIIPSDFQPLSGQNYYIPAGCGIPLDYNYYRPFQNKEEYLSPYIPPLTGLCEHCHWQVYHNEQQPCRADKQFLHDSYNKQTLKEYKPPLFMYYPARSC